MNFIVESSTDFIYLRVSDTEAVYYKKFSTNDYAIAYFDTDDRLVGIKIFDAIRYIISEMKYMYSVKDINYYLDTKEYPVTKSVNDS